MDVVITTKKESITPTELLNLYESVGWLNSNQHTISLSMILNCAGILAARDNNDKLIGFVKVLSDGEYYTQLAEIIVHPNYQRQGIGKQLMNEVQKIWGDTPIFIMTSAETITFFEKCGYIQQDSMSTMSKWFRKK